METMPWVIYFIYVTNDNVRECHKDSKHRLWVEGSNSGLNLFQKVGSFITFHNKEAGTGRLAGERNVSVRTFLTVTPKGTH